MTPIYEREAFEAWYAQIFPGSTADKDEDGEYITMNAANCWICWQAATAAERERAARVCDYLSMALDHVGIKYTRPADAIQCAAAIRKG